MSDAVVDGVPAELTGPRRVVEVVTTHLEMFGDRAPALAAPDGATLVRAAPPSVRFYRYLYDAVGAPWHWYDRKRLSDDQLAAILGDPRVVVLVGYLRGDPIGYAELDHRDGAACEVAYFGLVPEAIGRGLGRWLLAEAVHAAWRQPGLSRLWVHTCSLDGPNALATYQRAGFAPFHETRHHQYIVERA